MLSAVVSLYLCSGGLTAGEPPSPQAVEFAGRLVVTPKFTLPQVAQPIPGAKDTVLAAAWTELKDNGGAAAVRFLNKDEFAALGLDWGAFSAKTAPAASAELAKLEPELIRDRNEVIECAILRAKRPADNITVAMLAPDFLKRFTPLFGSKMLVVIPDRQTVYLFPKLASRYQDYGGRILALYRKSECPVSREVFELSATGLRAVGAYEEP